MSDIRNRLLERGHRRWVNQLQADLGIPSVAMDVVQKYKEVMERLELVRRGTGCLEPNEELHNVSVTFNGLLVYDEEFPSGSYIDALPRRPVQVEVLEILVNEKTTFLAVNGQLVWRQLDPSVHRRLLGELRETQVWKRAIEML